MKFVKKKKQSIVLLLVKKTLKYISDSKKFNYKQKQTLKFWCKRQFNELQPGAGLITFPAPSFTNSMNL